MLQKHLTPYILHRNQNLFIGLSKHNNSLEQLAAIIDFKVFRPKD